MPKLLLIDSNGIMHRAYHALPPLTSNDGTPTNVIYGFFSMLYKAISDFKPEYLICVFDTPKPTFRNKLFKEYQAQRPKIKNDFVVQIPLLKEALDKSGIFRLEKDGFEADDLIGSISKIFSKNNFQIIILSGDKDIFQLISDNVFVASPQLGLSNIKIFDKSEVEKKLEVLPSQIPDYKALVGDPSDNYPGAKGIGPKTAIFLLRKYQNIDNIYKNLTEIKSEKIRKILIDEKENIYLSKKLATILTNLEINLDIEKIKFQYFKKDLKDFLEKYQIYSLLKRIFPEKKHQEKKEKEKNGQQIGLF